jgi:adenosylhomocysteinase
MQSSFDQDLKWTLLNMPRSHKAIGKLPPLQGIRLALSTHLDIKMIPAIEGFLERGASVFLSTCNPSTVRNEVVHYLCARGAQAHAWKDMPEEEYKKGQVQALKWGPTHLCEMGSDLTSALHSDAKLLEASQVKASLEGTGSGIQKLQGISPSYPIFNWDDVSAKEGLHNRFLVGLMTCTAFLARTKLTFHGKNVLIIGYGLVGRGMADAARCFGGVVSIAEMNTGRSLEASYRGWNQTSLEKGLPLADVVITATGARLVLNRSHFELLRDGAFLINIGHANQEIDVPELLSHPHFEPIPFVKSVQLGAKTVYLFSDGAMANLVAGDGDSLNTFDITLAVMIAGLAHIIGKGQDAPAGCHLMPETAWTSFLS